MEATALSPATQSSRFKYRPAVNLGLAAPSILLVENTVTDDAGHARLLRLLDCKVDLATSGRAALRLAKHAYDLVLIDTNLPDLCGLKLSKLIKDQHHLIHVPIIALVHPEKSHSHGSVDEFLAKPITPEKLISALARWIK